MAYVLAVVAGAAAVTFGLFSGQIDGNTGPFALGVLVGITVYAGMISFVPALIVIAVAEVAGWRALIFYLAAGGAIGFIAGETTLAFGGLSFAGNLRLLCLAGGFVGGAVYWLLAGKLAGLAPQQSTPTSPG